MTNGKQDLKEENRRLAARVAFLEARVLELTPARAIPSVSLRGILKSECDRVGVTITDVCGRSKSPDVLAVRKRICVAAADAGYSTTRIGRALGGRHHTTVLHYLGRLGGGHE